MRRSTACLFIFLTIGLNCNPPGDPVPVADDPPEQVEAVTPTPPAYPGSVVVDPPQQGEIVSPPEQHCHSGTLECADGPVVTSCGTWHFDADENGNVSGAAEITAGLGTVPAAITLTGHVGPGYTVYEILMNSETGGSGAMRLSYDGPTPDPTGDWEFTDGPEPQGVTASGGLSGTSCEIPD